MLEKLRGKTIILGVLDLSDTNVERPETVAARIRRALPHVDPKAGDCRARLRAEIFAAGRRVRQNESHGSRRRDRPRRARRKLTDRRARSAAGAGRVRLSEVLSLTNTASFTAGNDPCGASEERTCGNVYERRIACTRFQKVLQEHDLVPRRPRRRTPLLHCCVVVAFGPRPSSTCVSVAVRRSCHHTTRQSRAIGRPIVEDATKNAGNPICFTANPDSPPMILPGSA